MRYIQCCFLISKSDMREGLMYNEIMLGVKLYAETDAPLHVQNRDKATRQNEKGGI
jgi:hypothetical protein